uniref:Secreted protein n=1 Tax=Sinocyclocheilus grahami TaxID=75366 RepID=A0A672KCF0_SINGR
MHFTQVLISLSVLIACGSVGHGDITAHQQPSTATEESEQCSTCEFRQHSKLMRLHSLRPSHLHSRDGYCALNAQFMQKIILVY